ncbi:MAG: T9SS type A sorting domain-containing protein [Bacteroidetes bacterium]|nr:T9SS type A sorting domain-containing protein [Bacteroidota bacterium]MBL6944236.1 T9SS type A sorting domain-containing protein [Bacteroidales bacterium]
MKNIYSVLSVILILFSISVFGQAKIYAPTLKAPANSAINQMTNAVLDWDAVTGLTLEITYEAQIATNPQFIDAVTFPRTEVTAKTMSNLLFGGTYYWRVRAYDEEIFSAWSETWSFTVVWSVTMNKPNDGAMVYANPNISWYQLTGVTGYQLEVDTVYAWNFDESGVTDDIYATYIVNNNNMWAVGVDGLVLFNDGNGWSNVDAGTTENLNDVTFLDSSNGYVVGDGGTVLFYDGATWTILDVGTTENLLGVSFVNTDNGVVVGEEGEVILYNTGAWEAAVTGDNNDLYDVVMLNPTNIWACGLGKIVVNYNGAEWFANEVGSRDHYAIAMIDENNGWTVTKGGKINRWDGVGWYEESSGTTKNLYGLSFDGMHGYAVGASGTILMFNGTWNKVTSGISKDLHGVMIAGDNGLIAGNDGIIMQKVDNGFNSPYLASFNISSGLSSWDLNELFFGQTFYYRMRAIHDADTSLWSGVKSLNTYASPSLNSPSNNATTDLLVKFKWNAYGGSTNYIFEIDTNANFTHPRNFAPDEDTLWVNDLVFGTEYFWRVAAQHALEISDWSVIRTINTVNTITLERPLNEAVQVISCPLYTWKEVAGASAYELWIDVDEAFSNPQIFVVDEPHYQCQTNMEKNTVYYWKVRGKSGPLLSGWSATWWFKTEGYIGIDEQFNTDAVNIYPNPGNGEFNLYINSFVNDDYLIKVIDISGKLINETEINCQIGNNNIPFVLDKLNKGAYNLTISNGKNVVSKLLLIK